MCNNCKTSKTRPFPGMDGRGIDGRKTIPNSVNKKEKKNDRRQDKNA
jgi:hypothetical protein